MLVMFQTCGNVSDMLARNIHGNYKRKSQLKYSKKE